MQLDGRVAIVTGAGRGIGAAIARRFGAEGALLVLNDLGTSTSGDGAERELVDDVAADIAEHGGQAVTDGGDVADIETGERLVRTAIETYGRLDVVVNVAGILRDRMIFNLEPEDWDAVIRVHLRGHYSTVRPASRYFREHPSPDGDHRIINFTSLSGLDGSPGQPNYAAAKLGVVGFTYSLAHSLARYGVTANAIAPGAATRMTASVPTDRKFTGRPDDDSPVRSPDNIATVAAYMASPRSGWLSGRTIKASGFAVGLYTNPEVSREIVSDHPWDLPELSSAIESSFRRVADGLPPNEFTRQTLTA